MKQVPFDRLIQTIKSEKVPFSVVFEITKRCNLRCLHCYLPSDQDQSAEMEIAEIRSLLDDLEKAGCLKLTLTGGEPTLRGDFLEILSYCHQKGFATTLFTNATLLTTEVKRAIRKKGLRLQSNAASTVLLQRSTTPLLKWKGPFIPLSKILNGWLRMAFVSS